MGGGLSLSKKKFTKEEKMLKQVRRANALVEGYLTYLL